MTETGGAIASEKWHWYQKDGIPAYEVVGKNGKLRPTTLRDARSLGLVPSVSGVIRGPGQPNPLVHWHKGQVALTCAHNPRQPEEGVQAYLDRVLALTRERLDLAPDLGTKIHGEIERALTDTVWIPSPEAAGAIKTLREWCGLDGIRPEKSFAHPYGYGGKVDVHKAGFVADFKSKEFTELDLPKTWDNHAMQLAAYAEGLNMLDARCAIIFVSTSVPGLTHLVEIPEDEITRGWNMFVNLLWYWQEKNRYWPITIQEEELI